MRWERRLAALGFSFDQMIEDYRCDADMRGRVLAQLQTWANSMVVIAIIAVKRICSRVLATGLWHR